MPIMPGKVLIVNAIQSAMDFFRSNLTVLVPEIFAFVDAEGQQEITTWYSNSKNKILVRNGYPIQPLTSPAVYVSLGSSEEIGEYITSAVSGSYFSYNSTIAAPIEGASFRTMFMCNCFSVNANALEWLQMLVRWALLFQRHTMEINVSSSGAVTGYFVKQVIRCSDMIPVSNNQGDSVFPWTRTVSLVTQHLDTWPGYPYSSMVAGSAAVNNT